MNQMASIGASLQLRQQGNVLFQIRLSYASAGW